MDYRSYHSSRRDWHPRSSLFDCENIAQKTAAEAIREGNELREKLFGRRILETVERKEIAA